MCIRDRTSPDDVLGHAEIARGVAPIRVATGEHAQNRMIFKQLLQAEAIQVMQIDAVRVAGVNENIANLLLAAKFGVPVCPHAGGVEMCIRDRPSHPRGVGGSRVDRVDADPLAEVIRRHRAGERRDGALRCGVQGALRQSRGRGDRGGVADRGGR